MRLLTLLLTFTLAGHLAGQDAPIPPLTADFTGRPLTEAITYLEKKYDLIFSFPREEVTSVTVRCNFRNADWPTVAQCLFRAHGLAPLVAGGGYLNLRPLPAAELQSWRVCLRVTGADQDPLPFATAALPPPLTGLAADENGQLTGTVFARADDNMKLSYLGYQPTQIPLRDVLDGRCPVVTLAAASFELRSVEISEYLADGISTTDDGRRIVIRPDQSPPVPGFAQQEAYRTLSLLPGVNSLGESAGNLSIRGGSSDQNLVLWDGIPVYSSGHFFGMISNFSTELIDEVSVWRGRSGPAYGGRISGVVTMETPRETVNQLELGAGLSLLEANAYARVPIVKNKSDLQLAFRTSLPLLQQSPTYRSYREQVAQSGAFDRILDPPPGEQLIIEEAFNLRELNGRWQYNFDGGSKLTLSGFLQRNEFDYRIATPNGRRAYRDGIGSENTGVGLTYEQPLGTGKLSARVAHAEFRSEGTTSITTRANEVTTQKISRMRETTARLELDHPLGDKASVQAGVQWQRYANQYGFFYDNLLADSSSREQPPERLGPAMAAYGTVVWPTSGPFRAELGFRLQHYAPTARLYPEPRLDASYRLSDTWLIKAAYGANHQFPQEVINLTPQRLSATAPIWVLADDSRLPVAAAREASFGFTGQPRSWLIDVDVYRKQVNGITSLNSILQRESFARGRSRAFGVDVLVKKQWSGWRAWAIYSLSRTEWLLPSLQEGFFPADNDRRHQLRLVGSYRRGPWSVTGGWQLRSGAPYTTARLVTTRIRPFGLRTRTTIETGPLNAERLPPFHRLDLSVYYDLPRSPLGWRATAGLSLLNLYDQDNLLRRWYLIEDTGNPRPNRYDVQPIDQLGLGFTPNVSIRVSWGKREK